VRKLCITLVVLGVLITPTAASAGPLCGLARAAAKGVSKVTTVAAKSVAYVADKSKVLAVVDKTAQAAADVLCKL